MRIFPLFNSFLVIFALCGAAISQIPLPPTADEIIAGATDRSKAYRDEFRNFLADEKKTFSQTDRNGATRKTRLVESTFLVYRLPGTANVSAELRNIRAIDGKPVPDAANRNARFLAEIERTGVSHKVLRKLQAASEKYDRTILIFGMTLHQAVILEPHIRPVFDFELAGSETIGGRRVYVVNFRQRESSPFIRLNEKPETPDGQTVMTFETALPAELVKSGFQIRGRLLIDAATFSVLGETRELVLRPNDPVPVMRSEFAYSADQNGVILPREISLVAFKTVKTKGKWTASENYRVDFSYDNFRRTEVDVRIIDNEP